MFVRVKAKATGHEFDVHEEQFNESKHSLVKRYPPSKRVRRTKFRVGNLPAFSVSTGEVEEGVGDGSDDS